MTAIVLQLQHTGQIPAARARLAQLLATTLKDSRWRCRTIETLNPFYGQTVQFFASIFGFISVLIGAIVLFTVGNTMSMAVVERTAEIGTLRAIGLRRAGIRRLFMCEGDAARLIGAVLGVLCALLIACADQSQRPDLAAARLCRSRPADGARLGRDRPDARHAVGLMLVAVVRPGGRRTARRK